MSFWGAPLASRFEASAEMPAWLALTTPWSSETIQKCHMICVLLRCASDATLASGAWTHCTLWINEKKLTFSQVYLSRVLVSGNCVEEATGARRLSEVTRGSLGFLSCTTRKTHMHPAGQIHMYIPFEVVACELRSPARQVCLERLGPGPELGWAREQQNTPYI